MDVSNDRKIMAAADAACALIDQTLPDGYRYVLIADGNTAHLTLVSPTGELNVHLDQTHSDADELTPPLAVVREYAQPELIDVALFVVATAGQTEGAGPRPVPMWCRFVRGADFS